MCAEYRSLRISIVGAFWSLIELFDTNHDHVKQSPLRFRLPLCGCNFCNWFYVMWLFVKLLKYFCIGKRLDNCAWTEMCEETRIRELENKPMKNFVSFLLFPNYAKDVARNCNYSQKKCELGIEVVCVRQTKKMGRTSQCPWIFFFFIFSSCFICCQLRVYDHLVEIEINFTIIRSDG